MKERLFKIGVISLIILAILWFVNFVNFFQGMTEQNGAARGLFFDLSATAMGALDLILIGLFVVGIGMLIVSFFLQSSKTLAGGAGGLITASDIISKSVSIYRENFALLFKYVLLLFAPVALFVPLSYLSEKVPEQNAAFTAVSILGFAAAIAFFFFELWFSAALIRVIAGISEGRMPGGMKEELSQAKRLLLPLIRASILSALAIIGGFILLIIPGIIFSVWYCFSSYAVLLDGERKAGAALSHSRALVTGRWWAVVWRLIAPAFVFAFITMLIQGVLGFVFVLGEAAPEGIQTVLGVILQLAIMCVSFLLAPLSTAAITILYLELKKSRSSDGRPVSAA